jgi:hypothetical protein
MLRRRLMLRFHDTWTGCALLDCKDAAPVRRRMPGTGRVAVPVT